MALADRFWSKVARGTDAECWLWMGGHNSDGYGVISDGPRIGGRDLRASRVSWELAHGPIPDGLLVLHRCDVPACVNPGHLLLGTHADNMADMKAKRRGSLGDANVSRRRPGIRQGERNGAAKLTARDIPRIREMLVAGDSYSAIGARFDVSKHTVYLIRLGKRWAHVP